MSISNATINTLKELKGVIQQLNDQEYAGQIAKLGNSSIGQHVRHTLEFYQCLLVGCEEGLVNYDNRIRDITLETQVDSALSLIDTILHKLQSYHINTRLTLEVNYELDSNKNTTIDSNLNRELVYNIEHAIHHMAIIKIGLNELPKDITIPEGFGIAVSTIKHQKIKVCRYG